ncbi:MAG: bacterial Ig-like domain-containing protein [Clostridia bacterium]|nr:bacterial Ig-like domain-containing protein [Clostridia bacterium]
MKKKIGTIISIILFIILICNVTYASEINVTLKKDKEKYTGGDVVEIAVKVNNIMLDNGIETIIGKISYNKDLYENCVIEESNNWEADFNEQNGKIILQRNEAIKENHTVFVIKLTIKDNIVNNDTISFTDINIADENTDLFPQNATLSISIENIVQNGEQEIEGESGEKPEVGDKENKPSEIPEVDDKENKPSEIPEVDDKENKPSETPEVDDKGNRPGEYLQEKKLIGIELTKESTKKIYKEGENFDKTGIVVIAKYSDGTSKEVTNYTYTPSGTLKVADKKIIISYTDGNVTKKVDMEITVKNDSKNNTEDKEIPVIKVPENNTEENKKDIKDNSVIANKKIPKAGVEKNILFALSIVFIVTILSYLKYKKVKDI